MPSLQTEPTQSHEDLLERRLETLKKRAQDEHDFLRTLAQRKLREFGERFDVSAYGEPDPDALYEEQQLRERGYE